MKYLALLKSRRAQAVAGGILTVIFMEGLGLDLKTTALIVGLIMSWVIGDSLKNTE